MAGSREGLALVLALGFMLGAFGQIPINDFMIGKMANGGMRARVYGIRYVVSFTALAAALLEQHVLLGFGLAFTLRPRLDPFSRHDRTMVIKSQVGN